MKVSVIAIWHRPGGLFKSFKQATRGDILEMEEGFKDEIIENWLREQDGKLGGNYILVSISHYIIQ